MSTQSVQSAQHEGTVTAAESAAIVRRAYAAFNSADVPTLQELFHEDSVWHAPGRSHLAGDYEGRDATLGYLGRLGQETGGKFSANLVHMTADDEGCVVGVQRSVSERNGKQLDVGNCIAFTVKNGQIVEVSEHFDDLYTWDEFWA
jgi:ketosteroid isomerase-like protein